MNTKLSMNQCITWFTVVLDSSKNGAKSTLCSNIFTESVNSFEVKRSQRHLLIAIEYYNIFDNLYLSTLDLFLRSQLYFHFMNFPCTLFFLLSSGKHLVLLLLSLWYSTLVSNWLHHAFSANVGQ